MPKSGSKVLFKLDFFLHGTLYCCVRYSNIIYIKVIIISIAQRVLVKYGFGRRFHDLKYFEVRIFFIFLQFIIKLRNLDIKLFRTNHQFNIFYLIVKKLNN